MWEKWKTGTAGGNDWKQAAYLPYGHERRSTEEIRGDPISWVKEAEDAIIRDENKSDIKVH